MTVKVVIKPKAEADLEEIWQTISYDDPLAADRDSDPVDEVEIIRIVDGRRDLTELF